jgi:hypothetical protein
VRDTSLLLPWAAPKDATGIPVEVRDEVELWAREHGRHGRIYWNSVTRCACIELDLKPGDPRLEAYQKGRLKHKPVEAVYLHRWDKNAGCWKATPPRPQDLSPDAVRQWLDRGNLWSGRGESAAKNLHDACVRADRAEREFYEKQRDKIRERTQDRARDRRRQVLDLPLVTVPRTIE